MRRGFALLGLRGRRCDRSRCGHVRRPWAVERQRLEPLGGAADQPGPAGRQHRPVRVRQPGRHEQGHDRRQLHPARGAGQRAELPELRRHRSLRDQDRQQRRRQGRHRLPVPVHDDDAEPEHVPLQHRPDHVARATRTGTGRRPTPSRSSTSSRTGTSSKGGKNRPVVLATTCRRLPTTSARARRRTTTPSRRRRSRPCRAAARSSPASVTTRSSSTSARSSTWPACGRSTRST